MRRVGWMLGVAMLTAGTVVPAARAATAPTTPAPQWVLVKITAASATTTTFTVRLSEPVERDGASPLLFGYGEGGNTNSGGFDNEVDYARMSLWLLDNVDWSVTTSKDAGAIDRTVAPRTHVQRLSDDGGSTSDYRITPPGSLYLLAFVTNGHFTDAPIEVLAGDVVIEERQGTGTGLMTVADPGNSGVAAAAGGIGAGTVSRQGVAPDGVVGTFVTACNCTGAWTSPDGRGGRWESTWAYANVPWTYGPEYLGDVGFSGPAGSWTLSFSGTAGLPLAAPLYGDLPPLVAAWADIGADWVQFQNFRPEYVLPTGPRGLIPMPVNSLIDEVQ